MCSSDLELGLTLCNEFTFRFDNVHDKVQDVIKKCIDWSANIPGNELTPFAQAMPIECKDPDSAVNAYRNYYRKVKMHLAEWRRRETPEWYYKKQEADNAKQAIGVGGDGAGGRSERIFV